MRLSAKEKAKELVHMFYISLPNNGSFSGQNNINSRWKEGKNSALLCVKQMEEVYASALVVLGWDIKDAEEHQSPYFAEVKEEIEKL